MFTTRFRFVTLILMLSNVSLSTEGLFAGQGAIHRATRRPGRRHQRHLMGHLPGLHQTRPRGGSEDDDERAMFAEEEPGHTESYLGWPREGPEGRWAFLEEDQSAGRMENWGLDESSEGELVVEHGLEVSTSDNDDDYYYDWLSAQRI